MQFILLQGSNKPSDFKIYLNRRNRLKQKDMIPMIPLKFSFKIMEWTVQSKSFFKMESLLLKVRKI